MNEGISLYELQQRIKRAVSSSFTHQVWIKAEVSAIKANYSGHCYIDLIDKDAKGEAMTAKVQAIVWSSSWKVLRPYFESSTGSQLTVGMNILVKVQVQFSELYGLSLIIYDIDPSYSVGEMELRRIQVIERLKKEGMFDMNTTLELSQLPRRFAIISSETAAGLRDFLRHLHENEYGFTFQTTLFSAPMQGADAPAGIINSLDAIAQQLENGVEYDAVLILRGGGSMSDLVCFDDYALCANIAQFPLPVMVAVGHDQDYHIADMVANVSVKTPTALADFIIDIFASEDARISSVASRLSLALNGKFRNANSALDSILQKIGFAVKERVSREENRLELLEHRVVKGNPLFLLEKGYAIALKEGRRFDSAEAVNQGDVFELFMKDGLLECIVNNKRKI